MNINDTSHPGPIFELIYIFINSYRKRNNKYPNIIKCDQVFFDLLMNESTEIIIHNNNNTDSFKIYDIPLIIDNSIYGFNIE